MGVSLKAREEKLPKDAATMTEVQRASAEKELRDGYRELQRKQAEVQDDFNARRNEEMSRLQPHAARGSAGLSPRPRAMTWCWPMASSTPPAAWTSPAGTGCVAESPSCRGRAGSARPGHAATARQALTESPRGCRLRSP